MQVTFDKKATASKNW